MMSGMRNSPPISMSSPRDTITSLPRARLSSARSTAEALLLTTSDASAPRRRTEEAGHVAVPRAALLRGDVHLEVAVGGGHTEEPLLGERRQEGAPQVGVEHDARS